MIMKKTISIFTCIAFIFFCLSPLFGQETPPAVHETTSHSPFPFEDIKVEQTKANDDHFISDFMNMLASLGLIIALIFIVSWFLKRFLNTRIQQINTTSAIKIVERRALTPKSAIYLLEVNGRSLVIAESTNGVTVLSNSHLRGEQTFSEVLQEKTNNPS